MVILQFTYQNFAGMLLETVLLNGYKNRQGVLQVIEF